jgi:hypothetical protein
MPTARINNQPTSTGPFTAYSLPISGNAAAGGGKLGTNNHIAVFPFDLSFNMLITNISVVVGTAGGAANNYDLGIYDKAGNLKAHVGAQIMNTTGAQTFALTAPITLAAGTYLFALTGVATTLGILVAPAIGGAGAIYMFDTTTTSTGGALPTLITLTSNTTPTATALPAAAQWSLSGTPPPLFILT